MDKAFQVVNELALEFRGQDFALFFKENEKKSQSDGVIGDSIHFYGVILLQKGRNMRIRVL